MLMRMRALAEASRALAYWTAAALDLARRHPEPAERRRRQALVDLLIPVVKAWSTDRGVECASLGVQVHGGMGFIEETGAAQLYRDARILPIYEGTNGIQAMDLVGRKLGMRMGGVMADHMTRMRDVLPALTEAGLGSMHDSLATALDELQKATDWIMAHGLADPRDALAGATPYLELFGLTNGGWLMARQALGALGELGDGGPVSGGDGSVDAEFLRAKVTTARFFCEQLLPKVSSLGPSITAGAEILYEIDADTFARR
jgi:acyl-CoA dehydrogenase